MELPFLGSLFADSHTLGKKVFHVPTQTRSEGELGRRVGRDKHCAIKVRCSHLPELCADLVAALADLKMDNLSHSDLWGVCGTGRKETRRGQK